MKRILVAYDGAQPARRALALAADLAHAFGAEVSLVSVAPTGHRPGGADVWAEAARHERQLREARDELRRRGVEAELIASAGNAAEMIERIATEREFDVVIVGSRGRNGIARALQGSVSAHVATHTPATVVVAR